MFRNDNINHYYQVNTITKKQQKAKNDAGNNNYDNNE